jgi:hypothetical protein
MAEEVAETNDLMELDDRRDAIGMIRRRARIITSSYGGIVLQLL